MSTEQVVFWFQVTRWLQKLAAWVGRLALAAEARYWRSVNP